MAVLLLRFISVPLNVTLPVFEIEPGVCPTITPTVMFINWPAARLLTLQLIVPPAVGGLQLPKLAFAVLNFSVAGNVFVKTTPLAVSLPTFLICQVYVSAVPTGGPPF